PAGQAADDQIVAEYSDIDAIHELARRSDVLTYEFENVDLDALESVKDQVFIPQGTKLLYTTNNRIREKTFIQQAGCEVAKFRAVKSRADLEAAVSDLGLPAVLKTCEGGYDGKGQVVLKESADLDKTADVLA
ncbi:ATP-grasp domain-containing protein, partial [Lactobacillus nasalidis]